jgi:hypothetical protein
MNFNKYLSCLVLGLLPVLVLYAQQPMAAAEQLFPTPLNYVIPYTTASLKVDGDLSEQAWQKAPWTSEFVDIEGAKKPLPTYKTQVKMLWSDSHLYIAAQLTEPHIWAKQLNHDDIIFKDNDFEVFIDPDGNGHDYFEIEINALNKIFDLFITKPYRVGGNALISWDITGFQSAVHINGTLNQAADVDRSWTIEMAIPLKALSMGHPFRPPSEGSLWRINFSRVQWDTDMSKGQYVKRKDAKGKDLPEHNWVWSAQGLINMHYPERWGYLLFTKKEQTTFKLPYQELQKKYLWLVYERQQQHRNKTGKYALSLKVLGIPAQQTINGQLNELHMEANSHQFTTRIGVVGGKVTRLNQEGLIH